MKTYIGRKPLLISHGTRFSRPLTIDGKAYITADAVQAAVNASLTRDGIPLYGYEVQHNIAFVHCYVLTADEAPLVRSTQWAGKDGLRLT